MTKNLAGFLLKWIFLDFAEPNKLSDEINQFVKTKQREKRKNYQSSNKNPTKKKVLYESLLIIQLKRANKDIIFIGSYDLTAKYYEFET